MASHLTKLNKKYKTAIASFASTTPLATAVLAVTPITVAAEFWLDAMLEVSAHTGKNNLSTSSYGNELRAMLALVKACQPHLHREIEDGVAKQKRTYTYQLAPLLAQLHASAPNWRAQRAANPQLSSQAFTLLTQARVDEIQRRAAAASGIVGGPAQQISAAATATTSTSATSATATPIAASSATSVAHQGSQNDDDDG